jgi:hypothetical protein
MATTHDPLLGMRQEANRREQAEAARQILESGGTLLPAGPMAPFSTSNDAALAAHLQQTREQNTEFLRLRTEEARAQFIDAAKDNFRRTEAAQQEASIRGTLEREQTGARDAADAAQVMSELYALGADPDVTNKNPWTAPLDKLRVTTQTLQKAERLQSLYPQQQPAQKVRPETFPDGSLYQLENLPDGNLEVRLITGEVFRGDPISVTRTIAESNVHTKRYAQGLKAQAQQPQQTAEPMQLNQQQPTAQPTEQSTIADYWADQQAKALGFSNKTEMIQWGEKMTSFQEQYENERLVTQFVSRCPDFPGTDEANAAVIGIVQANGWQYTPDNLQAAHALAIRNHVYEPLSAEAIQAANGNAPQIIRPTAPPMLRTNNPEISNAPPDPHNMPMDQLRRAAIKQELERSGPNYR